MLNRIFADLTVAIHLAFILFVIFGGLLVLKYPRMIWVHLPAAIWGALIEFAGWLCPLTLLENRLRSASGDHYAGGFIEHYLVPIIYPSMLTPNMQIVLGFGVILLNLAVYGMVYARCRKIS
ncbi:MULTISPECIES: DUF2784 domain-containing protein [Methylomicrobium]|uniref:DUF2784 domain-containing protein n=1 Tax=Methylomicrobium album BG8 TaxID=686340 RepID=H8GJP0_METAL|nr:MULTISPECIES: DUF2784 domain-containing protein [Methylomicrobium]EIC31569.1 Protein of Unknown function (DUF2784) [Methylomicrobium album BG8]